MSNQSNNLYGTAIFGQKKPYRVVMKFTKGTGKSSSVILNLKTLLDSFSVDEILDSIDADEIQEYINKRLNA